MPTICLVLREQCEERTSWEQHNEKKTFMTNVFFSAWPKAIRVAKFIFKENQSIVEWRNSTRSEITNIVMDAGRSNDIFKGFSFGHFGDPMISKEGSEKTYDKKWNAKRKIRLHDHSFCFFFFDFRMLPIVIAPLGMNSYQWSSMYIRV